MNRQRKQRNRLDQSGFTILELMIATTILSTMLLLVTATMISIGVLYDKGVNQARVQEDIRTISDDVSENLELNAGSAVSTETAMDMDDVTHPQAYCIGTTRYTYIVDKELGVDINHVLWRDTNTASSCSALDLTQSDPTASAGPSSSLPGSGTELMAPNSRLTQFSITTPSPYTITIGIAYGANDLLCDSGYSGPPSDCSDTSSPTHSLHLQNPIGQIVCSGQTGEQFCATANLTTTVAQRLICTGDCP